MRILIFLFLTLFLTGCGGKDLDAFHDQAMTNWQDLQRAYLDRTNLVPELATLVAASTARQTDAIVNLKNAGDALAHFNTNAGILTDPPAFHKFVALEIDFEQALGWMMTVAQNYDDLAHGQNYIALKKEILMTNIRIYNTRAQYNRAATIYDNGLNTIRGRWWYRLLNPDRQPLQLFTLPDSEGSAAPAT